MCWMPHGTAAGPSVEGRWVCSPPAKVSVWFNSQLQIELIVIAGPINYTDIKHWIQFWTDDEWMQSSSGWVRMGDLNLQPCCRQQKGNYCRQCHTELPCKLVCMLPVAAERRFLAWVGRPCFHLILSSTTNRENNMHLGSTRSKQVMESSPSCSL